MPKTRSVTRSSLREFDFIRFIRRQYGGRKSPIVCGVGDDAAVIAPSKDQTLLTTDLLTEGVHFSLATASYSDIGYRAAAANLSDIAAMGGTPRYVLVGVAIPREGTQAQLRQLYRGMMAACRRHRVRLIGGDTSASSAGWFLSLTLVGSVAPRQALLRSGARKGDEVYVTGTLGDSRAGLELLQAASLTPSRPPLAPRHKRFLIQRHLRPTAQVSMGRWLSKGVATAAIDLSDGLSGDLRHLCTESGVGTEIDLSSLPVSSALHAYAHMAGQSITTMALAGGEDYELLFTAAPAHRIRIQQFATRHHTRVTRIGTIRPAASGIVGLTTDGRRRALPVLSYEHFRAYP